MSDSEKSEDALRVELERLLEENRELRGERSRADEHERLLQELRVHQVELELQNRELRDAHIALEESRSRYADLYDFAPVAYFTLDSKALILDVNLTGASMLGHDRARLIGMPFSALVKTDQPNALWAHLRRCESTARPAVNELRFAAGDREAIDVQVVSAPVFDVSGRVIAFRTAFTDISQRRKVETELASVTAEENRRRRRSEVLDATGVAFSNALTRIGIAPPDELFDVIVARTRASVDARFAALAITHAAFGSGSSPSASWILMGPDGRPFRHEGEPIPTELLDTVGRDRRPLRVLVRDLPSGERSSPFPPEITSVLAVPIEFAGRIAGCLVVGDKSGRNDFDVDDISMLEMIAERAGIAMEVARLLEVESRERTGLRSLAESGTALLSTLERGGALTALCRGGLPWLADVGIVHEKDGAVLRAVEIGHADPESEQELAALREREEILCDHPRNVQAQVVRTGEPTIVTRHMLAASGTGPDAAIDAMVWHARASSLLIVPIRSRAGIVGTLTLGYSRSGRQHRELDIRYAEGIAQQGALALENARLYEKSRAATRTRDDLLAVVSHDLRTPLSSIALSAAVLARPGQEGERRRGRKQVDVILRSTARMGRLIDDLLEAATIEAGKFAVVLESEQAASIAEEALDALAPIAAQKSVRFEVDVPADLPAIKCDRRRVMQIVSNLIGNAIKFVPPEGRIALRARAMEREVCFSIADDGPGIAASEIPRLFDRYWRGDDGGTGLGLYIARGIVEAHGGRISVESRPGEGCTFHFTIPIEEREGQREPESERQGA
ncbi:MAG: ATP-binding protein [Myxococcota bacterium]|nr:ATP-binding protein [Myxococcota bacterium]